MSPFFYFVSYTALHRDNVTENTEWRYRMWPTGSRSSTRIGYTARDIHLLRFRLGLFWAEHTFGRIPQRHTKKNRPIWYRLNSHCWSSKQYFARDGTNQHGPLTWRPSKSNKPPYDRDTDGKAKVRWLTNRKEGPGMGGSENRITYAPNSSQTRYMSVRWKSRDKLFPHPPILWTANCFPSKKNPVKV